MCPKPPVQLTLLIPLCPSRAFRNTRTLSVLLTVIVTVPPECGAMEEVGVGPPVARVTIQMSSGAEASEEGISTIPGSSQQRGLHPFISKSAHIPTNIRATEEVFIIRLCILCDGFTAMMSLSFRRGQPFFISRMVKVWQKAGGPALIYGGASSEEDEMGNPSCGYQHRRSSILGVPRKILRSTGREMPGKRPFSENCQKCHERVPRRGCSSE